MICPFHVAVSKLDNVYRSATAMKLCTVALWLPEAFLAIHACLTGFWKSSLEASYMFMLQMLVWPGLCPRCSCGCSWKCSALQKCLWLRGARCILMLQVPALALLSSPAQEELCPHSTDPSAGKGSGWPGSRWGWCKSRDSWTLWPADLADR